MENKKKNKKLFKFYSISSPEDFVVRIKEEAVNSNLKIEQNDTGFNLQLDSNHSGKIVYKATVSADENGGSYISGEITTIPWRDNHNKKKSIFEKIFLILCYIVVIPLILIFLVCYGIYILVVRIFQGKSIKPTKEEKLCNFMIYKMCCNQKY